MPQIFLPYTELFWGMKCVPASLEDIASAGFNGVECCLIGRLRSPQRVAELRKKAADLNLKIHLHQGWSRKTGQPNLFNVILSAAGALVPVGASLTEQVGGYGYGGIPVVIYGNMINDPPGYPNYRYQTASEHNNGQYAMSFNKFTEIILQRRPPIVFDTQHVLEWSQNVQGVEGLPTNPQTINDLITGLWDELSPSVVEIHLNDFNPRLGRSRGRNVFPGDGIFPLKKFCALVRKTGWDGVVVPEVAPQHLSGANRLRILRGEIERLFYPTIPVPDPLTYPLA